MASTEPSQGLSAIPAELFDPLVELQGTVIERITSFGNTTPPAEPYLQDHAEWVVIVAGAARVRLDDDVQERSLGPGDHLLIPAHQRHWVTYTANPTVWIAVHFPPTSGDAQIA